MDRKGGNRRGSRPPHRRTPHQIGNHARALLSRLSAEASVLVLRCGTDDTRRRGAGAIRFLRSKSDEYGSLTGETMERLSEGRSAAQSESVGKTVRRTDCSAKGTFRRGETANPS